MRQTIDRILEPFKLLELTEVFNKEINFLVSKGETEFTATICVIHYHTHEVNSVLCEAMKAKCINVFTANKILNK